MTPTQREAMEMALEALGLWASGQDMDAVALNDLRFRIEAALAEQEQEPVAWMTHGNDPLPMFHGTKAAAEVWGANPQPLYTAPARREWVGLTDEEIDKASAQERDDLLDHIYEYGTAAEGVLERIRKLCRAIEAKLKEKNNE